MEKRSEELIQAEERIARLEGELSELREIVDAERFEQELLVREKAAAERRIEELEEEAEGLKLEVERLAAAKATAELRLLEGEGTPKEGAAHPGCGDMPVSSYSAERTAPRQVPRRPPPKGAFFHVDWEMPAVDYESPKDILDVYQSMNMSQLSLEGYHGQHCSAWIVGVKKGRTRQVYVVFGLVESGLNLVYKPAKPVRDSPDYTKALDEAVKFLEVVGYLPEKMSMGNTLGERGTILRSIPVLQGPQEGGS